MAPLQPTQDAPAFKATAVVDGQFKVGSKSRDTFVSFFNIA